MACMVTGIQQTGMQMPVDINNYPKLKGCFRIAAYYNECNKIFEEIHGHQKLMAIAFSYDAENFPSLPETTKVILKFDDHLELLSNNADEIISKPLEEIPQEEIQFMNNLVTDCRELYKKRSQEPGFFLKNYNALS
jgi:hypothetical protein